MCLEKVSLHSLRQFLLGILRPTILSRESNLMLTPNNLCAVLGGHFEICKRAFDIFRKGNVDSPPAPFFQGRPVGGYDEFVSCLNFHGSHPSMAN